MSIYTECGEAARRLLDDASLRPITDGPPGVFTELDVIFLAARDFGPYNTEQMRLASREASQVMGMLFRNRQAVRFGPVLPVGTAEPDFARIESKIVYAAANGPTEIHTPNGTFPRMYVYDGPIGRQGRRLGASRNDLELWSEQNSETSANFSPEAREILRLRAEVASLRQQLDEAAQAVTREDLVQLMAGNGGVRG